MKDNFYKKGYKYISVTQMKELLTCPAYWYIKRRTKGEVKRPYVFVLGDAFHKTEEWILNARMYGFGIYEDAIVDYFTKYFYANLTPDIDWFDYIQRHTENPESVWESGKNMLLEFNREINPKLNPIAVENRFQLDVPGRAGWRFTGKMDMVDEGAVYDHKTAIFPWRAGRAEEEIQATGMLWAWNSSWLLECKFAPGLLLNKKVENWEQTDSGIWVPVEGGGRFTNTFIYNIVTKGVFGKSVVAYQQTTTRTQEQLEEFEDQLRACIDIIESGEFPLHKGKKCIYSAYCSPSVEVVEEQEEEDIEF